LRALTPLQISRLLKPAIGFYIGSAPASYKKQDEICNGANTLLSAAQEKNYKAKGPACTGPFATKDIIHYLLFFFFRTFFAFFFAFFFGISSSFERNYCFLSKLILRNYNIIVKLILNNLIIFIKIFGH